MEGISSRKDINYLLTYDSYGPLYNIFHRGEWITRDSGGEGALDTPGPLNGNKRRNTFRLLPQGFNRMQTFVLQ